MISGFFAATETMISIGKFDPLTESFLSIFQ